MTTRARSGARAASTSARTVAASGPQAPYRVLMYSHDSFGLGQLRRCHAIAHALVARHQDLNVLILTGSPIIGRFRFRARVDFVRLPGVVRLRNGGCTSLSLEIDLADTLALRASIIEHTAQVFRPHLFLVDETPLGLLGEAQRTLRLLKRRGCRLVLGLHDVVDGSTMLTEEGRPKQSAPGPERLYDHVWIYGLPEVYDPVRAHGPVPRGGPKMVFTGYLGREPQPDAALPYEVTALAQSGPFLLVTPGGGSDGAELIHTVLTAHERFDAQLPWPSLIVYGPFLSARHRAAFEQRAARLGRVTTLVFHEHLETLMEKATAVVCSGGYNTFCEVLSLGKRCLIVPRETPRGGQLRRAEAARKLGLVQVLHPDQLSPETLAEALTQLRVQSPPRRTGSPVFWTGSRTSPPSSDSGEPTGTQRPGVGERPVEDQADMEASAIRGPHPVELHVPLHPFLFLQEALIPLARGPLGRSLG